MYESIEVCGLSVSLLADPAVESAIAWSELLEPLLINNYESDPALAWQYFGSSEGFVRMYPGNAKPEPHEALEHPPTFSHHKE